MVLLSTLLSDKRLKGLPRQSMVSLGASAYEIK